MKKWLGKLMVSVALVGSIGVVTVGNTGCKKNSDACVQYLNQVCSDKGDKRVCKWAKDQVEKLGGEKSSAAIDFCEKNLKK